MTGEITAPTVFEASVAFAIDLPGNFGTDRVAIAGLTDELEPDPGIFWRSVVLEEERRFAVIGDEYIDAPIIVVVPNGQPSRGKRFLKNRAGSGADVLEDTCCVFEEEQRLFVFDLLGILFDHVVRVPVGKNGVDPAVIVEIEKFEAPTREEAGGLGHGMFVCRIDKGLGLVVLVEGEHFLIDIGDEEVLPAIVVDIECVDSHSRSGLTTAAEGNLCGEADLFPLAFAAIHEQEVLDGIVGDEEVHIAVVVYVSGYNAESLAEAGLNVSAVAHQLEAAIAIVVEEHAAGGFEDSGDAIVFAAHGVVAT